MITGRRRVVWTGVDWGDVGGLGAGGIVGVRTSKLMKMPVFRLQDLRWRTTTAGVTFLRSSGLPFLTVAMTMSPTPAWGNLFKRPPTPKTDRMYRFLAPVLSAQFMTAPTGRARDILSLLPAHPRPSFPILTGQGDKGDMNTRSGLVEVGARACGNKAAHKFN